MARLAIPLLALAALAAGCAAPRTAPGAAPGPVETGRAFVHRACAGCHAVDPTGASPNPRAPAFRDLAARRSDAELAAAVAEISRSGHVEMPPIYVTPEERKGVVAYMRSLTGRAA
jgi:cytochrome c